MDITCVNQDTRNDLRYLKLNQTTSQSVINGTPSFYDLKVPRMSLGSPTYSTINDFCNSFGSCGRKTGGTITDATGGNVSVSAGTGFIKASDDDNAQLMFFDWAAPANIAIPSDSTRYIGVEYNGGNPQVVARTTFNWNLDSEFPLGRVISDNINGAEELYIYNSPWWVTDGMTNTIEVIRSFGLVRRDESLGGLILSVTGTRNIAVSSGTLWSMLNEFSFAGLNTASSGTFEYYWYKAGTGWQSSDATQYSVTQWNDVTQTALQTIDANKYLNVWVYGEFNGGVPSVALIYPQAQYNTAAAAEAKSAPDNLPTHIKDVGKLLGRIIIKQGVDAPISVETVFTTTFSNSVVTDHGNLSGLSDDDHTQYWLSGTARTGNFSTSGTLGAGTITGTTVIADSIKLHPSVTYTIASSTSRGKNEADYICDGTDDQVQIQAAIDASTKSKIVLLEGDFNFSAGVNIKADIWIEGQGQNVTFIKASNAGTYPLFQYNSASTDQGFVLRDLTLYGYTSNCYGVVTKAGSGSLQDVFIERVYADGFGTNSVFEIGDPWGLRMEKVIIENGGTGTAINITANGSSSTNAIINNCKIKNIGSDGIVLNNVESCFITSSEFYVLGGSYYCIKILNSNKNLIQGNSFNGGTGTHVAMDGDSDANMIQGNMFDGQTTTPYAIIVTAGATYNLIENNWIYNYATGEIADSGTGTLLLGNHSVTAATRNCSIYGNLTLNGGTLGAGAITGTSFIIGANTLTTTEWAYLDGQDQAVKSTSNVTFGTVGAGATTVTAFENTINSVTGTTQALAVNKRYLVTGSSKCTLTLPSTATIGQTIEITTLNTAGIRVAQNANQYIRLGNQVTTTGTGGYIENIDATPTVDTYSKVVLECIVENNGWLVTSYFTYLPT